MHSLDLYEEYRNARGEVALAKDKLLTIDTSSSQNCSKFGIHPNLPLLRDLYDDGEAIFLANIGVLTEPVTKDDYEDKTLTQLFAHNTSESDFKG